MGGNNKEIAKHKQRKGLKKQNGSNQEATSFMAHAVCLFVSWHDSVLMHLPLDTNNITNSCCVRVSLLFIGFNIFCFSLCCLPACLLVCAGLLAHLFLHFYCRFLLLLLPTKRFQVLPMNGICFLAFQRNFINISHCFDFKVFDKPFCHIKTIKMYALIVFSWLHCSNI